MKETSEILSAVRDAISKLLAPRGFSHRNLLWSRTCPEVVQQFGLERWTWGPTYNIRIGMNPITSGFEIAPRLNQMIVEWHPEAMTPKRIWHSGFLALDFTNDLAPKERVDALGRILLKAVIPLFDDVKTLKRLRAAAFSESDKYYTDYVRCEEGDF